MISKQRILNIIKKRRARRVREKISGTAVRPRASIFRSNNYTYIQLIDDVNHRTLVSASTREFKSKDKAKVEQAKKLGILIAKKAKEAGVSSVAFDRGGYKYHGRVKAVAEALKENGIKV